MANARLQIDTALFAKLNTATVLAAALGGVHNGMAPEGTAQPWIIYQAMSKIDEHTFSARFADAVYLVKAVARGPWPKAAMDVDTAIDTALEDTTLTITGFSHLLCRRTQDVYLVEEAGGEIWQHIGGLYRIIADQA